MLDLLFVTYLWRIGAAEQNFAVHLIFHRSNLLETNIDDVTNVPLSSAVEQSVDKGMNFSENGANWFNLVVSSMYIVYLKVRVVSKQRFDHVSE